MNKFRMPHVTAIAAAMAVLALAGCQRQGEDQTAGQKLDSTIAKTEQRADQAKADIKDEMAKAKESTAAAGDKLAAGVEDASITASVNAELAKDPTLSALSINVDTSHGRVMLRGTAPNSESRDRASRLALAVKGVVSVDNRLEVHG